MQMGKIQQCKPTVQIECTIPSVISILNASAKELRTLKPIPGGDHIVFVLITDHDWNV